MPGNVARVVVDMFEVAGVKCSNVCVFRNYFKGGEHKQSVPK